MTAAGSNLGPAAKSEHSLAHLPQTTIARATLRAFFLGGIMKHLPETVLNVEARTISRLRLTKLLQENYSTGTRLRRRACLMKRCQRILQPVTPSMKTILNAVLALAILHLSAAVWAATPKEED